MKEGTPDAHDSGLPPCSLSARCTRLLDEQEEDRTIVWNDPSLFVEDAEDRRLLAQLRIHVAACPTCAERLTQARVMRSQQRRALRQVLREGEWEVPATTASILLAVKSEEREQQRAPGRSNGHVSLVEGGMLSGQPVTRHPTPWHFLVRNILALVAVLAIILASISLFSRMLPFHLATGSVVGGVASMQTTTHAPLLFASTWSSVVMATMHNGQKLITNTDPVSGKSAMLASSSYPTDTDVDGVSHDGYKVLYRVFDGSSTRYYIQPSSMSAALYTLNGRGSRAIWSTDDHYIFIGTAEGIEKVDVNSHSAMLMLSTLKNPDLYFYRDGYLYFVQNEDSGASVVLSRVSLASGSVHAITVGSCALSYDFWLSPGGTTVYYHCKDRPDLYAVDSDGTHARSLRLHSGDAIGYGARGELLTLLKTGGSYQVIELGVDTQHDQVVFPDVAPGAVEITTDDVAVMPYGQSLVVLARYADGTSKIWYDDLIASTQHTVKAYIDAESAAGVQFCGWSKLQVS